MALFPVVIAENELQMNDKTRIDCSMSFASKGSPEVSTVTVLPYSGATAVSVFDSDKENWFLDWSYSDFKIDVTTENDDIVFDVAGTEYSANLTVASYTLANYATHVASVMTTAHGGTFSASTSGYNVTITGPASFSFKASSVSTQLLAKLDEPKIIHGPKLIEYGQRLVTCTVSDSEGNSASSTQFVNVYSQEGDKLFCTDQDLVSHESDILKWVAPGRASFKNIIRRSQKLIIAWMDEKGYVDAYGYKYTKAAFVDIEEVRQWSIFMSLRIIFESMSNSVDDVFSVKSKKYEALEQGARQRAVLRVDFDNDGVVDLNEGVGISSGSLFRR